MTIRIKIRKDNDRFTRLFFWIPTSLMKAKFIIRLIMKKARSKDDESSQEISSLDEEISKYCELIRKVYKSLRNYIKKNGHFTIVDVHSSDDTKIKIRI